MNDSLGEHRPGQARVLGRNRLHRLPVAAPLLQGHRPSAQAVVLAKLAERYNITRATVAKWKGRETPQDLSHRRHKLSTTLAPAQEAIAVELRRMLLLPLDHLLVVVREFINPAVSRSGLDRCLRRHGVANLRLLQAQARADAGEVEPAIKTFKDYEPGFVHMDIKYLPGLDTAI